MGDWYTTTPTPACSEGGVEALVAAGIRAAVFTGPGEPERRAGERPVWAVPHPGAEFARLLTCCHKIVDYAKVCRARSCDDCTNTVSILRVKFSNRLTQINARHAAFCVGFNFYDVCIHCICGKADR